MSIIERKTKLYFMKSVNQLTKPEANKKKTKKNALKTKAAGADFRNRRVNSCARHDSLSLSGEEERRKERAREESFGSADAQVWREGIIEMVFS